jgi:hypothetical protein
MTHTHRNFIAKNIRDRVWQIDGDGIPIKIINVLNVSKISRSECSEDFYLGSGEWSGGFTISEEKEEEKEK